MDAAPDKPEVATVVPSELPIQFCSLDSLKANERRGVLCLRVASKDVNYKMRAILVDWMMEVWKMFKLKVESFFAGVNIMDAVLGRDESIERSVVQLMGATSLWVASKYHEIYPPEVGDIKFVCDNAYTQDQILEMETKIFKLLGCNVNIPEEMDYLRAMSHVMESTHYAHTMAKHLLFIVAVKGSRFLPSVVISAVKWILCSIYKEPYTDYFGVPEEVLKSCASEIITQTRNIQRSSLKAYEKLPLKNDRAEWGRVLPLIGQIYLPVSKYVNHFVQVDYIKDGFFVSNLSIPLLSASLVPDDDTATILGEGTFGVVKAVEYQGKTYAVKQSRGQDFFLSFFGDQSQGIPSSFCREVSIMQCLDHPHIAKVRHITDDLNCIFLDLGVSDLFAWIQKNGPIDHSLQPGVALQLLSALAYLHDMGCLHRDIKPKNIIVFIDEPNILRLALSDFGSGRGCQIAIRGAVFTQEVCTMPYRSPEVFLGMPAYDDGLDVWSMLCTLYECATGQPPFNRDSETEMLLSIFRVLGTPTEETWPGVTSLSNWSDAFPHDHRKEDIFSGDTRPSPCYKELLNTGLILNPSQRPRAKKLLEIAQQYN